MGKPPLDRPESPLSAGWPVTLKGMVCMGRRRTWHWWRRRVLIARDLRKHFQVKAANAGLLGGRRAAVRAADGVSLTLFKGETLGVVGAPDCITVQALRHQVQMVFQDRYSSLNPRRPIQDSVAFRPFVQTKKQGEAREIARDILVKVGLNPSLFGPRYPHELLGGQKQRVNIARALAISPRMVILDEAVYALDKSIEAQVLNVLRQLKRSFHLTYVFISHDPNMVQYISDWVLVMYLGHVVELGPVEEIFSRPLHP